MYSSCWWVDLSVVRSFGGHSSINSASTHIYYAAWTQFTCIAQSRIYTFIIIIVIIVRCWSQYVLWCPLSIRLAVATGYFGCRIRCTSLNASCIFFSLPFLHVYSGHCGKIVINAVFLLFINVLFFLCVLPSFSLIVLFIRRFAFASELSPVWWSLAAAAGWLSGWMQMHSRTHTHTHIDRENTNASECKA